MMKYLSVMLVSALTLAGCGGESPTMPSPGYTDQGQVPSVTSPAGNPTTDPAPSAQGWSFSGPTGCIDSNRIQNWTLTVRNPDADIHILKAAFHDPVAGCEPTVNRATAFPSTGPMDYSKGQSDETHFYYDAIGSCGRFQVDVSLVIRGVETLVLGTVINTGKSCPVQPPLPPSVPPIEPVACTPLSQTTRVGNIASLDVAGGDGAYQWSAPGGVPETEAGRHFIVSYREPGERAVTVTSAGKSAMCMVRVLPSVAPPPLLPPPPSSPANARLKINVAQGPGDGYVDWSWSGGSGRVTGTGNDGNIVVPEGTVVWLKARASSGSRFEKWTGNPACPSTGDGQVVVTRHITCVAHFR